MNILVEKNDIYISIQNIYTISNRMYLLFCRSSLIVLHFCECYPFSLYFVLSICLVMLEIICRYIGSQESDSGHLVTGCFSSPLRTVVDVIAWQLYLQLPIQPVPITSNTASSNPAYSEVYLIQHCVIQFVSDLQQAGGFLCVLRFPPPIKLTATKQLKYS